MYIAGLLSRDAKSEGWKREPENLCVFYQFPEDGLLLVHTPTLRTTALYHQCIERKTAPRVAAFEGHSSSHQETCFQSYWPLPGTQDCLGQLDTMSTPQPSAIQYMADEGHITVPRKEDLVDDSVWLPQEMRESLTFYCTIEA